MNSKGNDRLNRKKNEDIYFSGFLHNLSSSLQAVMVLTGNLKQESDNKKILQFVEKIRIYTERMNDMIKRLAIKNKVGLLREESDFSLNQLIKEVNFLQEGDPFYRDEIENIFQLKCPHKINGQYIDFFQIVNNLFANAKEAMYESVERKLYIDTFCDENNCYFSIRDTGCGISEENISKIFNPFYSTKSNNLLTERAACKGMGLTITKQILEFYGREIIVESKPNVGSKFLVRIPRK